MLNNIEELKTYLHESVSEKRFIHSLGVAETTEAVLHRYHKNIEIKNNFNSAIFCGLAHDLGREFSDEQILDYCKKNNLELNEEQENSPVLAHGIVSADIAKKLCGDYPESWHRAICIHTTGDKDMDDLALALFIADYIEPSRVFMTEEKRAYYLSSPSLKQCAYLILIDMINHWKQKGYHDASGQSLAMLAYLKEN